MATYKQIQDYIKNKHGYSAKPCWIAHAKEMFGLNPRQAYNRQDAKVRKHPCPEHRIEDLKEAFRHYQMI